MLLAPLAYLGRGRGGLQGEGSSGFGVGEELVPGCRPSLFGLKKMGDPRDLARGAEYSIGPRVGDCPVAWCLLSGLWRCWPP